jgi:hypothetical protein
MRAIKPGQLPASSLLENPRSIGPCARRFHARKGLNYASPTGW